MVADLVLAEGVLIGVEVAAEETSGMVVQQEEIYLAEEDIHLPEVADLNIRRRAMILDLNIIQDRKDIQAEVVVVIIQTVIKDLVIHIPLGMTIDHLASQHVKG